LTAVKKDVSALRIQDGDDDHSVTQTDDERRGTGASTQLSESAAQGVLRAVDDATAAVHKVRELSVWWSLEQHRQTLRLCPWCAAPGGGESGVDARTGCGAYPRCARSCT
jgi:hypothetical protein